LLEGLRSDGAVNDLINFVLIDFNVEAGSSCLVVLFQSRGAVDSFGGLGCPDCLEGILGLRRVVSDIAGPQVTVEISIRCAGAEGLLVLLPQIVLLLPCGEQ